MSTESVATRYDISVRSIQECGKRTDKDGQTHQEDSLFPERPADGDRVFVLCDGMGGHDAGEVASATVCEAMGRRLAAGSDNPFVCSADDVQAAVDEAQEALDDAVANGKGSSRMGTTMTCLVLHDGGATVAHIGDSRVYHIRPGKGKEETRILLETRDHSLVNDLVAIGEITPKEAKTHRQRNVLTRALQPGADMRTRADVATAADIQEGDYFMLCSDGILENMDDDTLRFIFSDKNGGIDNKVRVLRQATEQNRDNHTAIVVRIDEVRVTQQEPAPKTTNTRNRRWIMTAGLVVLVLLIIGWIIRN